MMKTLFALLAVCFAFTASASADTVSDLSAFFSATKHGMSVERVIKEGSTGDDVQKKWARGKVKGLGRGWADTIKGIAAGAGDSTFEKSLVLDMKRAYVDLNAAAVDEAKADEAIRSLAALRARSLVSPKKGAVANW